MPVKIGFAILTHNAPEQLLRLVKTLNAMFGDPPIVCHHDFSKGPLDEALFPTNVRFVHPHIVTRWGDISVPWALLKALNLLREYDHPDWYIQLSGSDYPVRPAGEIVAELSKTHYDAYLDNREILYQAVPPGQTAQDGGFGRPDWIPLAYGRYCAYRFCLICPSRERLFSGSFPFRKRHFFIHHPGLIRTIEWFQPWLKACRPPQIYGGDFWFQANDKAVGRLVDTPLMPKLMRYYRRRESPDESLFHTVLCSQPDLRICKDHRRYADWTAGDPHPKWLEESDVPKILASGAYFARKFRRDGLVQEFIDKAVLGISSAGAW